MKPIFKNGKWYIQISSRKESENPIVARLKKAKKPVDETNYFADCPRDDSGHCLPRNRHHGPGGKKIEHVPDKSNYFSDCPRNAAGHCLPKGSVGQGGKPKTPKADKVPTIQTDEKPKEGDIVASGVAVRALDTGRVLMLQRVKSEDDPASGKWEFPGGHIEQGESTKESAMREWKEEVGLELPEGKVSGTWRSENGTYVGYIYDIESEGMLDLKARDSSKNPDGDHFESVAWVEPEDIENHNPRAEVLADIDNIRAALDVAEVNKMLRSLKGLLLKKV